MAQYLTGTPSRPEVWAWRQAWKMGCFETGGCTCDEDILAGRESPGPYSA